MNARKVSPLVFFFLLLTGCWGEWVDDKENFKRVFDFEKPAEVQVIHSYYWKSPHWTVEYRYYMEIDASQGFFDKLTASQVMDSSTAQIAAQAPCSTNREKPSWFLPKPLNEYLAWIPKTKSDYRIFRDKADGRVFVCDMRL
ncbi:MAG TPA: hypothetical protein VGH51_20035 [Candidatus Angelobacter sp.]|jgi:hypothetical protein